VGRILVGTSGWQYDHWRGVLYPEGLPQRSWLARYAELFATVELNATFYRLSTPAACDRWREATPSGFTFAAKGSRFITHVKRLRDPARPLRRFFRPLGRLGPKLLVVLWQLPPRMRPDLPRLERFLRRLPDGVRHAFEFRDPSWYHPAVCDLLDRHGAAFCEHDLVDRPPPRVTGGFRYLRFHGTSAGYGGLYGERRLRPWAEDLRRWRRRGDAFAYFNNDLGGCAVRDALTLAGLLGAARSEPGVASRRRAT
jgi:uncharacterized protein YecE (DUF72 family)